jgi:hypothetical protein
MDELTETVALAVDKMRRMRKRLEDLRQENGALLDEVAKLDLVERARQEEINKRLRPIVDCIRIAQSNYLEGITNFVSHEKDILALREFIETGMGDMHLFLKKSLYSPPVKLDVKGKEIHFAPVAKPFPNPFTHVYDGLDEKESPGQKNFDLYIRNFKKDLEKHKSYAAIAYGPSGTGKTTMIQRIVKHLFDTHKPSIEVYQLYVRSPIMARMSKDIPFTQGATSEERLADRRVHERFDLCTVGKGDIVKVILNDVEMIQSVGAQMYKLGNNLYYMVLRMIVKKFVSNTLANLPVFIESKQNKLFLNEMAVEEMFDDQKFRRLEGFYETIQDKWIKPLSDMVDLVNNARSTLQKLVAERFQKEAEFFAKTRPTQEEIMYFVESGGFIPLHWMQYMDPNYHDGIQFFSTDILALNLKHITIYLVQPSEEEFEKYAVQYLNFTLPRKVIEDSQLPPSPENEKRIADANTILHTYRSSDTLDRYMKAVRALQVKFTHHLPYNPETQVFQLGKKQEYVASERFIDDVQRFSFQRSTPQNQQSSRCATVYTLVIDKKTVTFIDLPGNEDQVMGCESTKDDNVLCNETLGIRSLLKYVRDLMMVKRLNVDPKSVELDYPSKAFHQFFEPLMRVDCKVGLLCFAANYEASPNYNTNTMTTLQYMTGLKEAKFSCVDGGNQEIARKLLAGYKDQSEEEKRLLVELAPKKEDESPKVQLHQQVTDTNLSIPEIIYVGVSSIPPKQRVIFTLDYTLRNTVNTKSILGENVFLVYRLEIECNLVHYNEKSLVVLGSIRNNKVNFDLIGALNLSKKTREFRALNSDELVQLIRSNVSRHQDYKLYHPDRYSRYARIKVDSIKQEFDLGDEQHRKIPYNVQGFYPIKPPTVSIEMSPLEFTCIFITPIDGVSFKPMDNLYTSMKVQTYEEFSFAGTPKSTILATQEF